MYLKTSLEAGFGKIAAPVTKMMKSDKGRQQGVVSSNAIHVPEY